MELIKTKTSPLEEIDVSFANYVNKRHQEEATHMKNGIPDYAFALDYQLRYRLEQIPHFQGLCKKISGTIVAREIQKYNQNAVAVGPNQYTDIYNMSVDCAKRLGIGIPNVFIYPNPQINAFTIAADTISPIIVLFTGIVDRLTPAELKCVIAHECGHIHNQHTIYKSVISSIMQSGTGIVGFMLSTANMALMQFWTRACEVTADRAGAICGDNIEDSIGVQKKLLSGGTINQSFQDDLDFDALKEQLTATINNPTRFYEILNNHPSSIRRIFCIKEFAECEIFYNWRNELRKPDIKCRTKDETDSRCQKIINIIKNVPLNSLKYKT